MACIGLIWTGRVPASIMAQEKLRTRRYCKNRYNIRVCQACLSAEVRTNSREGQYIPFSLSSPTDHRLDLDACSHNANASQLKDQVSDCILYHKIDALTATIDNMVDSSIRIHLIAISRNIHILHVTMRNICQEVLQLHDNNVVNHVVSLATLIGHSRQSCNLPPR